MRLVSGDVSEPRERRTSGSKVANQLSRIILSQAKPGYRWAGLSLLALFAVLALVFVDLGAPPVAGGPWDTTHFLEAGWRIVNGQTPHTGYHIALGPLTYLLAAFGMVITAPSTASITYGNVLLFALLLPAAWYLAFRRFSWLIAWIFTIFEGFYLLTPRPPGYSIRYTSYAMSYNRQGYVMLAMVCMCVFLKRRELSKWSELVEGSLTGVILGLLLYCKITYFVAGVALGVVGVVVNPQSWRWFIALWGTLAGICAAFWLLLRISLYAYLKDIVTIAHAQSAGMRLSLLSEGVHNNAMWIYLFVFCLVLCMWAQDHTASRPSQVLHLLLMGGSILVTSLWVISGNTSQGGGTEDPLYFLAAIMTLEFFRRGNPDSILKQGSRARWTYFASLLLLVPVFSLPILAREVASCGYAVIWDIVKRPHYPASRRIQSVNLADFYVPPISRDTAYWKVDEFPERVNDGIALLRVNLQPGDRITTMAYANPFSFALGTPPASDDLLNWDLNVSFNRVYHPSPEDFLGDATLVMVPRLVDRSSGCCFESPDLMLDLYGDYLHSHFRRIASTDTWILFRRIAPQHG